jgi:hypothetical protein
MGRLAAATEAAKKAAEHITPETLHDQLRASSSLVAVLLAGLSSASARSAIEDLKAKAERLIRARFTFSPERRCVAPRRVS